MSNTEMHAAEGFEPAACSGQRVHNTISGGVGANGRAARKKMDAAEGSGPTASCGRRLQLAPHAQVGSPDADRPPPSPSGSGVTPAAVFSLNCAGQASEPARRPLPHHEEVARLYAAGWQAPEIAKKLGIKTKSVYTYASRARTAGLNIPPAPHPGRAAQICRVTVVRMAREGLHAAEIARRLGRSLSAVAGILAEKRKAGALVPPARRKTGPWTRWTDERFATALRIAAEHGAKAAAAKVGTTARAVLIQIARRGYRLRDMRKGAA